MDLWLYWICWYCYRTQATGSTLDRWKVSSSELLPPPFPSFSLLCSFPLTLLLSLQQAAQEITKDWTLFKQGLPDVPSWTEYLSTASHSSKLFPSGSKLGLDPNLLSITEYNTLLPALEQRGISLVPIEENLLDQVWGKEQPQRPKEPVFVLEEKYAGESSQKKIERVRKELTKENIFKTDSKNVGKKCCASCGVF